MNASERVVIFTQVTALPGKRDELAAAFADQINDQVLAPLLVAPIVLAVTFLASYIPARRASLIDPTTALRCE